MRASLAEELFLVLLAPPRGERRRISHREASHAIAAGLILDLERAGDVRIDGRHLRVLSDRPAGREGLHARALALLRSRSGEVGELVWTLPQRLPAPIPEMTRAATSAGWVTDQERWLGLWSVTAAVPGGPRDAAITALRDRRDAQAQRLAILLDTLGCLRPLVADRLPWRAMLGTWLEEDEAASSVASALLAAHVRLSRASLVEA